MAAMAAPATPAVEAAPLYNLLPYVSFGRSLTLNDDAADNAMPNLVSSQSQSQSQSQSGTRGRTGGSEAGSALAYADRYARVPPASWMSVASDCDEQLLMTFVFRRRVSVVRLAFIAHDRRSAPREVRLYANLDNPMFEGLEDMPPLATLSLTATQLNSDAAGTAVCGDCDERLTYVALPVRHFKSVASLTLFVVSNQEDVAVSRLDGVRLVGTVDGGRTATLAALAAIPEDGLSLPLPMH